MDSFSEELLEIQKKGLLRELLPSAGVDFSSNDYLSYSRNSEIRSGLIKFLRISERLGSTGSRLISGNSSQASELEKFLARCFQAEDTLIFGSGYLANLGVCAALGGHDTEFFSDELNHASVIDGIRLSKSKAYIYEHNDLNQLESFLSKSSAKRKVIVTESVFSMDGDFSPLENINKIAIKNQAYLFVDEAHATGTCGENNLGRLIDIQFDPQKTIAVHTCGKALGAYGAFVCSSALFKRLMVNKSRSFVYTTALPPINIEHIRLAVSTLISDKISTAKLQANIDKTKTLLSHLGIEHSSSHIIPVILGSNNAVLAGADRLRREGYFVKAIRSPTVAIGSERLRITLKSDHDLSSLERITKIISELKHEYICRGN